MLEGELGPDTEIVAQLPLYLPGVVKQLAAARGVVVKRCRRDLNSDHCPMARRETKPCSASRPVCSPSVTGKRNTEIYNYN